MVNTILYHLLLFPPMPSDPPLVLTQDHDPDVVFRGPWMAHTPAACNDLLSNFRHLSHIYNDLLSRHRALSDAHQALKDEHTALRGSYASLSTKHQEHVHDAITSRIQSWRYVVRVEELENELYLLKQGDKCSMYVRCIPSVSCPYFSLRAHKRKYIGLGDDLAGSESLAFRSSHSHSLTNDTMNALARFKTEIPHDSSGFPSPKRYRECGSVSDYERASANVGVHQGLMVSPTGNSVHRQEDATLETDPRPSTRFSPPQTLPKTQSSQRRWSDIFDPHATAAAIAAAFSVSAVVQPNHSSTPSPTA